MNTIPLSLINERTAGTLLEQLQKTCPSDVYLVKLEVIVDSWAGSKELIFWYSRVSEGMKNRAAGKPDDNCPKYPLKFPMTMWDTHIDLDMILAKIALVR